MYIRITDDFDLKKIAESGQCFRWEQTDLSGFRIIAADRCVYVSAAADRTYRFSCDEKTFQEQWRPYFDLDEDYRAIRSRIRPDSDPFLWQAAQREQGIRILRQDPWEMLISFIISQNRNIPAIRRSIEMLSEMCGEKRYDCRGLEYRAFPRPEQLAALTETQLADCRLGYRVKYIHAAAAQYTEGRIDMEKLAAADCGEAIRQLTGLYGVGNKVASCVALFGLHQLNAFPRDVWIKRVLENEYPDGYPFEAYSPYNGVYQQYMFAWYRERRKELFQADPTA